jgi:tryptophan-rich sensory protein
MHQTGWAFVEIAILWVGIGATMVAFFWRSKVTGWLMLPYLAWVSFASVLNFAIWRMNV